jgi:hypothetical protein
VSLVCGFRFVGAWGDVVVRIDCIQLNTATADSWSRVTG